MPLSPLDTEDKEALTKQVTLEMEVKSLKELMEKVDKKLDKVIEDNSKKPTFDYCASRKTGCEKNCTIRKEECEKKFETVITKFELVDKKFEDTIPKSTATIITILIAIITLLGTLLGVAWVY